MDNNQQPEPHYFVAHAPDLPKLPKEIAEAMLVVTKSVQALTKGETNEFGKYNYTSVDQIYEAVRGLLVEAGLVIVPYELEPVRIVELKGAQWCHFVIGFMLQVEGIAYTHPMLRETLFSRLEGPQTFNGAKSYAQKTWLRHVFKIPTNEKDLDAEASASAETSANRKAAKPKPEKLSPEKSKVEAERAIAALKSLSRPISSEAKEEFATNWGGIIAAMTDADAKMVRDAYKAACKGAAA